ncbi:HAD family hydrolase [Puerhibacterium sp. TATVAM-FAB25]|uniref:HAD family hydrolase n=1 Tax=Puerhibacterium sp. TATVAM-FAB25 TaxID=3093699 RepID=UPI0039797DCD
MTVLLAPRRHRAVIFDLDGVVTDTASVHADAWRQLFDEFLAGRGGRPGEDHRPFGHEEYLRHVDGRPRYDGVDAFLRSRGVALPWGDPTDPPGRETVCGLGNRKDRYFRERLARDGVRVFDDGVDLVRRTQQRGLGTAVISASRNCRRVLAAAGLGALFPVRVDGEVAAALGLPGKPDPAVLLEAARRLGVGADAAVVVEDAEAGVEAGRRGGFALVIGVARGGDGSDLRAHGADVVVARLDQVRVDGADAPSRTGASRP